MTAYLLIALSTAAATPAAPPATASRLEEARHAVVAGRLDQARMMIAKAIADGATGDDVNRTLADLAFASHNDAEALARYQQLLAANPGDPVLLERAGISAVQLGDLDLASGLIERATKVPAASWRAWNARGAIADLRHDWPQAEAAYETAGRLSPQSPEVANNLGWSRVLRGDWAGAIDFLQRATGLDPKSNRIANNLELARDALDANLPRRQPNETDRAWAARLNDAGLAAQLLGDKQRAIAAFSQALEASGTWYERAANNLRVVSGQ